ncbi:MAG: efflux RND transporter permease subunit [Verrucomicrobiae bacterium]|nr:efflux RND transporter permease subunit [Verrucomicrobiae bacterium]
MTLSDLSIRRPVFAWMIMFGLIVFGAISLGRLGVSEKPDVDFPVLTITANWPGAAPEVMEAEITDRIEQAVISIQGIRDILSTMRQGTTQVTLEFELTRDIDAALQEVQANISRIRLPKDVDPPTIRKSNPDDQPIMWLGVSGKRPLHDLIVYIDLHLRDQFQVLPGVGEVLLSGFADRNLRLWVDNEKLKRYELTILDLQKAIELNHTEIAAGYMENTRAELNVRMMGEGLTPEEVGNILITQRGGQPIYNTTIRVRDVARVEDSLDDIRRISRVNGIPGVGLGIKKQRGANAVEVARGVRARLEEIRRVLPKDIEVSVRFDTTKFIEDSVRETEFTLLLSAIITGLVCWIFLGSWRTTFNVVLSIPTSIVGTFMILYFMGFTLNFFTLLGLALAVGIVVDDAIMVLENIVRHQQLGKGRVAAAGDGAREITFAAIAASIAVVAIFLPVAFMKGIIGKFFFQFGVTISGAVMLSLLEAVTLMPMRCSQFLGDPKQSGALVGFVDRRFHAIARIYRSTLEFCLDRRWSVLLASFALFFASLYLGRFLRKEFIPPQDMDAFLISFQTPVGSSLQYTSDRIKEAEEILKRRPELEGYFAAIGGFAGGESNRGVIFVSLYPKSKRKAGQFEIMNWCRKEMSKIPTLRVFPQDLSMRGFTAQRGFPVEFNVRGGDYQVLKEKVGVILKRLGETGLMTDLDTDYREGMPEVRIWPDRARAAASSVSMETLGNTVNAAIGGVRQGNFTSDGRRYDVRLRLDADERIKAEDIHALQVRTAYGELLPITEVTRVETVKTLQTITRRMRERSISVFANVAPGKSQSDALAAAERVAREVLPEGYRFFLSGSAQTFKESFDSLIFALVLGVVVAYMVLASQFNSFLHPFIVLLALPFSVTGAFVALLLANQSLNLYSMIGMVLLMGIVKKNSILLVEFTNKKRHEDGMPLREAILTAAPIRLRPILMTSFATIAAAVPPALAFGPGAESRIPMAIAVIGGVLVSTFLTLIVVPCAYSLLARFERKPAVRGGNEPRAEGAKSA